MLFWGGDQTWPALLTLGVVAVATCIIRTILCLGTSAVCWARDAIGADELIDRFQERNNKGWTSQARRAPNGRAVAKTHPGRADEWNRAAEPTPPFRKVLG